MSDSNDASCGCGCGSCVSLILFIILITMIFFGLVTPYGKINLDLFPPRIWEMEEVDKGEIV